MDPLFASMIVFGGVTGAMSSIQERCVMRKQTLKLQKQVEDIITDSREQLKLGLDNVDELKKMNAKIESQIKQSSKDIEDQKEQFAQHFTILTAFIFIIVMVVAMLLISKRFNLL